MPQGRQTTTRRRTAKKTASKKTPARRKTTGVIQKGSVTIVESVKVNVIQNGVSTTMDIFRDASGTLCLRTQEGLYVEMVKTDKDIKDIAKFLEATTK